MQPKLILLNGDKAGSAVILTEEILIGRSERCQVRPMMPEVSRLHCKIRLEGNKVLLEDLGSLNGTTVGGNKICSETEIKDGDIIGIATAEFKLVTKEDREKEYLLLESVPNCEKLTQKQNGFLSRF